MEATQRNPNNAYHRWEFERDAHQSAPAMLAHIDAQAAEIERLRELLRELEEACGERAARLTREAYLLAEIGPGMPKALERLDAARRSARAALEQTK